MNKFYITTPIFYPNSKLHLGHAYVTVVADIFSRYHRLCGKESYLVTGADEHSIKVVKNAITARLSTIDFTDGITQNFRELFANLGIEYSFFVRTSNKDAHWAGAQELWNRFVVEGDIYKSMYEGLYCTGCESFIKESELVDGSCPLHNEAPQLIKEENYFFKLSKYQDRIMKLISDDVVKIMPESRKMEMISLIKQGINDVSFSRPISTNSWAVPIPGDKEHGMYVWCDALSSYLSAVGFPNNSDLFNKYWPADCHLVGKDILRFHAITWIGMLLSAKLPLPKNILTHGMILSGGKKMSKTLGNVIDPELLLQKYGHESLRYYFARHITLFDDGELSLDSFHSACKAGLLNSLGNLVSRVLGMAIMYEVPICFGEDFSKVIKKEKYAWYAINFESFNLNVVTEGIWKIIGDLDRKIVSDEPFKLIKTDRIEAKNMVSLYLEKIWDLAQLIKPILPDSSSLIIQSFEKKEKPLLFKKETFE